MNDSLVDDLGNCKICKCPVIHAHILGDNPKMVFHESFGFACLKHKGVKEHFDQLIEEANKKLERLSYCHSDHYYIQEVLSIFQEDSTDGDDLV